jgi:DNA-binding NtrC family response regulator
MENVSGHNGVISMRKQPGGAMTTNKVLTVVSLSPIEDDNLSLEAIIGPRWTLLKAYNLPTAWELLQRHEVSVVLCERDLKPGTWIDLLKHIQPMPHPPYLIVTSKLADERLWVDALNLGAWDVLAKPFTRIEVIRTVKLAWDLWHHDIEAAKPMMMAAAG